MIFSKYFYLASLTSYYTFYLINKFQLSVRSAQIHLFVFLGAVAVGTVIGGPVGDRIGRKSVIWASILGVLPFTLLLPYANLFWTEILSVVIGLILASAFSVIVVYAQELVPGKVGMISGLCFGFAFGMGGLGAAVLGWLADLTSIHFVYLVCSYLPAVGLLAAIGPVTRFEAPDKLVSYLGLNPTVHQSGEGRPRHDVHDAAQRDGLGDSAVAAEWPAAPAVVRRRQLPSADSVRIETRTRKRALRGSLTGSRY